MPQRKSKPVDLIPGESPDERMVAREDTPTRPVDFQQLIVVKGEFTLSGKERPLNVRSALRALAKAEKANAPIVEANEGLRIDLTPHRRFLEATDTLSESILTTVRGLAREVAPPTLDPQDRVTYRLQFLVDRDPDVPVRYDEKRCEDCLIEVGPHLAAALDACFTAPKMAGQFEAKLPRVTLFFDCRLRRNQKHAMLKAVEISVPRLSAALQQEYGESFDLEQVDLPAFARRHALVTAGGTKPPSLSPPENSISTDVESAAKVPSRFGPIPDPKTLEWAMSLFHRQVLSLDELNQALRLVVETPIGSDRKLARSFATAVRKAAEAVQADLIFEGKRCEIYGVYRKSRNSLRFDLLGSEGDELNTNTILFPALYAKPKA